ncbi:FkbM family methyltransferase [bacterium]|nr:FkbM family methyltransferase [bacterium]
MNKFFLKALNKFNLLEKVNVNAPIQLNNKTFLIPVFGKVGYSNLFITEPWMIGLLSKLLPMKSGVFVDVGVNIGQTLLKLRSVDADVPYIGFEPNPFCVNYSSNLISLNKMKNVQLLPFGVSDNTAIGVLNFFHKGSTDSSASIIADFRPDQKVVHQEFVPLYHQLDIEKVVDLSQVGFLKIDVEGAELEVLQSFQEVLLQSQPIILMEILPVYNSENVQRLERQNKIQKLLKECNYSIFRVNKVDDQVNSLVKLENIEIHSNIEFCEYVCVHESVVNQILNIQFN